MADEQQLIVDLRLRDNLTGPLGAAKTQLTGLQGTVAKTTTSLNAAAASMKGLAAGFLGISAVAGVVSFLGNAADAAREDEVSIVRLTQALKENAPSWDGQTLAIEKAIKAAQRLGFSDDEVRGSLTKLSAATHDLGQALAIQNTAMDLARFKGVSLAEATSALVTIEAGRFRGLAQLGIELKAGTTQTEALAAVQKVAAGQAEAFGRTSAGAAEEARVALDEAAESIGRGLLPILKETAHFGRDVLAPALTTVGENMGTILPVAGALATVFTVKLVSGLVASTAGFVANTAAMVANSAAGVFARDIAAGMALAQDAEAISANAAAAAEERLALARGGGALKGALTTLGQVAIPVAAAVGGFVLFEEAISHASETAATAGVAAQEYAHQLGILNDSLRQGTISQAQFDAEVAKLRASIDPAVVSAFQYGEAIRAGAQFTGDFSIAAHTARENADELASAAKALAAESTSVSAAQIRVAQATIDAAAAHADVANAQKLATEAAVGDTTAIVALAVAMVADKRASDELKAAQDALNKTAAVLKVNTLGTGVATDTLDIALRRATDAAIKASVGYGLAADELDRLKTTAGKPFVAPPTIKIPGLDADGNTGVPRDKGVTGPESFLSDLDQDQRNRDEAARREEERIREQQRLRDEALAKAKANALAYAAVIRDKVAGSFDNFKRTADTLFDKLHERHVRAINDAQKLAQTQHDAATQQISDALKVSLATNAAAVTEAEKRQQAIELARQRRDLGESLASATASGDPAAIRSAREALQSFVAQQNINALRLEQAEKDAAAQEAARAAQKAADDQLAAAKLQAAKDLATETTRAKAQREQFERELAALKKRDAGASPAKAKADIAKLEEKFGITRDDRGFSHITDITAAAVKRVAPGLADVGVAAAGATPKLSGLAAAEIALGRESVTAAEGLATFVKRLGELKVLELPIPEKDRPLTRQLETLERPRSVEDMLANAIKNIPVPAPNIFVGPINVYVPPITMNGRVVAAGIASSQSPSATPGVRTGTLSPRP